MAEGQTPKMVLAAGDTLPRIVLPDADGSSVDTADQFIAGNTLVFWVTTGRPPAEAVVMLSAMAPAFAAMEVQVFLVASEAPEVAPPPAIKLLIDGAGHLLQALGLPGPGIAICSPRGKLAATFPADGFAATMELCCQIYAASAPEIIQSSAPVLIVPDVLEPDFRAALIAGWEAGAKTADAVAVSDQYAGAARTDIKKRVDVMIRDRQLLDGLQSRLQSRLLPEISRAYRFDVMKMEPPRIGCYDAGSGGYFRRHRDNRTRFTAHRGFALTLNLNTGDYAGGQLRFPEFGRQVYAPPAGAAIVFSCNLLHEVMPVTAGRRFAVVTFFSDAAGAAQEERLIAAERAAGRSGIALDP